MAVASCWLGACSPETGSQGDRGGAAAEPEVEFRVDDVDVEADQHESPPPRFSISWGGGTQP